MVLEVLSLHLENVHNLKCMLLDRMYPHIFLNMSCREVGMLHRNRTHGDACFQEKVLDVHKLAHYLHVECINGVLHHQRRPQGLSQDVDKSFIYTAREIVYIFMHRHNISCSKDGSAI